MTVYLVIFLTRQLTDQPLTMTPQVERDVRNTSESRILQVVIFPTTDLLTTDDLYYSMRAHCCGMKLQPHEFPILMIFRHLKPYLKNALKSYLLILINLSCILSIYLIHTHTRLAVLRSKTSGQPICIFFLSFFSFFFLTISYHHGNHKSTCA